MRKKILQIIVVLVALFQMQTFAQITRVTGKVIGPDNNPVAGASVTISGTTQGTVTDADGNFALSAPSGASLLISAINSKEQVVKIDGRSVINVTLTEGQGSGLEEVVVTGYTAQKKKDIIGSVAVVDVKALKQVPSGSAMSALQGQAAGVNVVNNGSPGAESQILIRGVTGFANRPLVLIDGIQGDINDVPASDVESIQVLKDAGAAAVYGARGGNGVIIITTKKGKSGTPVITYDNYFNMQIPRSIDKLGLLTTEEYAAIWSQINPTTALFPGGTIPDYGYRGPSGRGVGNEGDAAVNPSLYRLNPKNGANNYLIQRLNRGNSPFYDAIMNPALMQQHNVTASGGTDKSSYLVSLGYLDHEGTLQSSMLRRYNARVNTTFKIKDNIRVGENLNVYYKNSPNPVPINGAFGPIQGAIDSPPFIPIYDIMGNYGGPFAGPAGDEMGDWGNPKANVDLTTNRKSSTWGFQGNVYLEVDFLKNFTAKTSIGGSAENFFSVFYDPRKYWERNGSANDRLSETSGYGTVWQWTNTLQYKNEIGKHNFGVLVGSEAIETSDRNQNAVGQNFFLDKYQFLVLGTAVTRNDPLPTDNVASTALYSLFGKFDYAYNEKYLLSLNARRDGFSSFGSENQFGNFFAVTAGWRISQEDFMKNVAWINDLKIRGSYGELGNKEGVPAGNAYTTFGQNPFFSYYDINGTGRNSVQGFFPGRYGNARTSWETNKTSNIGFDATLFNNKLDVSLEYYKKATDGLLFVLQLPGTAGEGRSPYVNIGDVQNKGIDLNVNYRTRLSRDVNFNVGVNFTTYKNKVVSLPDPGYQDGPPRRLEEGYPIGSFFGYIVEGVFKDQKDVDDHATQQSAEPGRWKYRDVNGDGEITTADRAHYGNANPDFTLGLNLGATFKNFDFNAIFYSAVGQDVYNGTLEYIGSWERGVSNKSKRVLDAWTPTNPNGTWKKAERAVNFSNSSDPNSAFIEKGSFFRLRNVQVGYSFAPSSLKNIGLNRFRIFVGGTNLFVITKYSGLDPEVPEGFGGTPSGVDAGAYAQEAGVVAGLTITF